MPPSSANHLETAIKQYIESRSGFGNRNRKLKVIETVFREFDSDLSGNIDEEEWLAALVQMNIVGCTESALELFDKYDDDMTGSINYKEFCRHLFSENEGSELTSDSARTSRDAVDVVSRVKKRILQLAGKNAGIRSVTRILRQMDTDGNKSLSPEELQEGLLGYGVSTSSRDIDTLMKHFDRDGSGKITIEEFLRGLRGSMPRPRRKLVRMAWDQLVSHLEMDGPGDSVTLGELASFYDVSKNPEVIEGRITPEEALRKFMSNWDKNGDDVVDWKEFLDYYKDLSVGIDNEDYFELMIRNAWHLSGGEGWAENTSNIRCLVTFRDGRQEVHELQNDFGVQRSIRKRDLIRMLEDQGLQDVVNAALSN